MLHTTYQQKKKVSHVTGLGFEHALSNSFIRISLILHLTLRKCQLGKPLINDKQRRNYAWYSTQVPLLPCQGVDPTLLQQGKEERRTGSACSLWAEMKWLNNSPWQPCEPLQWGMRALFQRVRAFWAPTPQRDFHSLNLSHFSKVTCWKSRYFHTSSKITYAVGTQRLETARQHRRWTVPVNVSQSIKRCREGDGCRFLFLQVSS